MVKETRSIQLIVKVIEDIETYVGEFYDELDLTNTQIKSLMPELDKIKNTANVNLVSLHCVRWGTQKYEEKQS